jgi:uncharacterized protein
MSDRKRALDWFGNARNTWRETVRSRMQRRTILKLGGAAGLAVALPLPLLFGRKPPPKGLISDEKGLLDLPLGFSYFVIERRGEAMSDGYLVPGLPDGMACFSGPNQTLILMRNHEVGRFFGQSAYPPGTSAPPEAYDATAHGGVTRVVLDARSFGRVSSNLVLTGTLRNCAGGPSPWGWLSCEETTEKGHGYVFLCRTDAASVAKAERIASYGRFNHEAVCIDPKTHVAYMTEDRGDSCVYRFVPARRDQPFVGKLQALKIKSSNRYQVTKLAPGKRLAVEWVDVDETDAPDDRLRMRAQQRGAAIVRRGEGVWFHRGSVYLVSTNGGKARSGQVLRLIIGRGAADTLEVVAEGAGESHLEAPDNITVAPWGDLYVAEDGGGDQYVRGITPKGQVFDVVRNASSGGEIAGVCFSPDGRALFLNLQREGLTLGVLGPFAELGKRAA